MRPTPRIFTLALSAASLLALGLTLVEASASAAGTLPTSVNEVVSSNGSLTGPYCPSFAGVSPAPTAYADLQSAVNAATTGQTIYVCPGVYDLSNTADYSANEEVDITTALTIDGYNWDVAPPTTVDPTNPSDVATQSILEKGQGILVQHADVTNNAVGITNGIANGIDVQSLVTDGADVGESNVTVSNNLFGDIGGALPLQNGDVHFGLGMDAAPGATGDAQESDITVLDTNDVVQDNVFVNDAGYENNAVQVSDTSGALVTDNTVNLPTNDSNGVDDGAFSAMWFTGFDQGLTVSDNTLNGGGIDSDTQTVDTSDPKSGIKVVDDDANQAYGTGCQNQNITGNTINGFVYGITMSSLDYTPNLTCSAGPSDFEVSGNTISNSRLYGIYVYGVTNSTVTGNDATISGNHVSNTDTEGYATDGYVSGDYDFYDAAGTGTTNTWTNNVGNGFADPSTITTTTTTTTTSTTTTTVPPTTTTTVPPTTTTTTTTVPPTTTTTTTTVPPTTTTTAPAGGGGGGGGSVTTTTTVPPTTTSPPTTTTTQPVRPVVTVPSGVHVAGTKVDLGVQCSRSRCAGILEITKKIGSRTEVLGRAGYAVAAGAKREISLPLNAAGLKTLRATRAGRITCVLTITSAAGTKRETISLTKP
jgi:parallel beta-helix repeat protein